MEGEELEKNTLSKNKLKGFVIKSPEIVKHLDNSIDESNKKSNIMPLELKSNGDLSLRTQGLYEEDFNIVKDYLMDKTGEICQDIYDGKIDIKPYRYKKESPCEYCQYKSICKFDPNLKGNKYRYIKKLPKTENYEDAISKMKEKLREKNKVGEENVD